MRSKVKYTTNSARCFRSVLLLVVAVLLAASTAHADVCVWRDPDRTMQKIFPQARDYGTIERKISVEKERAIENRLGKPLDPGEREDWIFYKITGKKGNPLGYVLTDAEKGEYGAIEIVMGITPEGKVVGIYIQRARELDKEFKSRVFLDQFIGKTKESPLRIGKDIKAESSLPTEQVSFAAKKMLIMYDELKKEK